MASPIRINPKELKFETRNLNFSPCGQIPKGPETKTHPKELIVRFQDAAVTSAGFRDDALKTLEMLLSQGATAFESLRHAWIASRSISTGTPTNPWLVAFNEGDTKLSEALSDFPTQWVPSFGGGRWIGSKVTDGVSGQPGRFKYSLDFGTLFPNNRGFFELYWAADNKASWAITNSGTIEGPVIFDDDDNFSPTKGPRLLKGTFQPGSVLTATVTNIWATPNPSGFLAVGTAGAFPDMRDPNSTDGPKLTLGFHVPGVQPKVFFGSSGAPVFREILPTFVPGVQNELRYLRVFFNSEPSEELLKCLRISSAVRFAERIPLVESSWNPEVDRVKHRTPNPNTAKAPDTPLSTLAVSGFVPPTDYRNAIKHSGNVFLPSDFKESNLAILDDGFTVQDHGFGVWSVASECVLGRLPNTTDTDPKIPFQRAVTGLLNKSIYTVNPSKYFSAMEDILVAKTSAGFPKIQVINLSRGSADWTKLEREYIQRMDKQGIVVVAAGGQGGPPWMVEYPAAFPEVVSVGGVDTTDSSQIGQYAVMNSEYNLDNLRCLDKKDSDCAINVVAPAKSIEVRRETTAQYIDIFTSTGTSLASPMVAALASLIMALDKNYKLAPEDVRSAICKNVFPVQPVDRQTLAVSPPPKLRFGSGLIQWDQAISAIKTKLGLQ